MTLEKLTIFAYTGTPLRSLSWNSPTLGCHWENSSFCSLHWNATGGIVTHIHKHTHIQWSSKASMLVEMTRWWDTYPISNCTGLCKSAFTWSLQLCNRYHSSALKTCEYFNITMCMPLIWAPLLFLCTWGCLSNEISLAQTILTITVINIRGCMLRSDLT